MKNLQTFKNTMQQNSNTNQNFNKKFSSIGVPLLHIDQFSKKTNLLEVTKCLDIYVQQNYLTLHDCIKTLTLRDIHPPNKPTNKVAENTFTNMLNNPTFMTILSICNPEAMLKLQQQNSSITSSNTTNNNITSSTTSLSTDLSAIDVNAQQKDSSNQRVTRSLAKNLLSSNVDRQEDDGKESKPSSSTSQQSLLEISQSPSPEVRLKDADEKDIICPTSDNEYNKLFSIYIDKINLREDELSKLFGDILSILSTNSLLKVKSHLFYNDACRGE